MGTLAWDNWAAYEAGSPEIERVEFHVFSDAQIVGAAPDLGPHALSLIHSSSGGLAPRVLLEVGIHADLNPPLVVGGQLADADSRFYHGGGVEDEVTALVSLELGVRLRVAGMSATTGLRERDTARYPGPWRFDVPRLSLDPPMGPGRRWIEAYAGAIWWANEDPNFAWLQFVTALEAAAEKESSAVADPVAELAEYWPEASVALAPVAPATHRKVAAVLLGQSGATRRFVRIIERYGPKPPLPRPTWGALDWDDLETSVRTIYRYRSKMLHVGRPFPLPMLRHPMLHENGAIEEAPGGKTYGGLGAIWTDEQVPMLLSAFEHITREVLLAWWDDLGNR